jgi:hypothetical protein
MKGIDLKNSVGSAVRLGMVIAGSAAVAVSAVGCSAPGTAAGAGGSSGPAPAGSTSSPAGRRLKFPNTTVKAALTGYDSRVNMVEFYQVRWVPGGPNNGHYDEDPADTAMHRLPLSDSPVILSALTLCPGGSMDQQGHATTRCTKDQLIQILTDSPGVLAEVRVDGADRIERVSELYVP